MGDKYETIGDNLVTQVSSDSPRLGLSPADATPLLDPEAELVKSNPTDLYTKIFEPEEAQKKRESGKFAIMIYGGIMILSILAFNMGVVIGYFIA